ncbi:baseplate J/gp47 family protein [Nitrosomonas oligotropha]|uniref:Baseplate J-like protein n=1 Tax=Nitrosomonas oligotropha TaxID=42354 RepID=A0A1H8QAH1_9PROT|nr:baseplate J/gp47 family protein [Nitrosomonas oligotropha]SDW71840.1 Baseplate J-like protein [Nitrosomonas oligotropha]SEO51222.1 Baseplate J-like protein [Nitrosomonas oligotropha]
MKLRTDWSTQYHLHISDGKNQEKRLLPALEKDYFNVADMRFHTLLALLVEYAQVMKFYNLNNREDGTWAHFFSLDETVVIATILAVDLDKLATGAAGQGNMADDELTKALRALSEKEISQHMMSSYTAVRLLDRWLQLLARTKNAIGTELRKVLESVITGLRKDIDVLGQYLAEHVSHHTLETIFSRDLMTLLQVTEETALSHANAAVDVADAVPIRSSFYAFVKAIEMVQGSAEKLLSVSLTSKDHEPAAGLLLAFLQLFQKLHDKINRFTLNYVDFYYDQVLKVQPRGFTPDHVYVALVPNKKNHSVLIPKGTEFLAGKDENKQDIIYTADDDVLINDASVSAIHTLFFKRDPLNFPENGLCESVVLNDQAGAINRQIPTGGWLNDVPVLTGDSALDSDNVQMYPLFGAPKKGEETILVQHARIGFALASKALWLQEGRRTVSIHMKYTTGLEGDNKITLEQWVRKIAVAMQLSGSAGEKGSVQEQQAFFKAFRDIFIISLSVEGGWREIAEYLPSYSGVEQRQEENSLTLTFFLPENFPAVVPYDSKIHGEGYETGLPVVRLVLNPKSYLYPYGILSKLELDSIRIDVAVEGCRTVQLHNNIGQLSPLAPFAPFGPLPEVGSYLIVGCSEAAGKQLSDFNVEIQWGGLPAGIGGFKTHYQGYETFGDTDFRVSTTVLSNGKWLPENAKAAVVNSLFQIKTSLDGGSEVSAYRKLSCAPVISYWSPFEYRNALAEFAYTPSTHRGFFKFTLAAPGQAFGHRDYPTALANVLTFNAKQKHAKFLKHVPNPPYTPMITSIAVNYKASAQMIMGKEEVNCVAALQERMIYLHPLGWKNVTMRADQAHYLLPQFLHSGNLLIGLKGLTGGGVITLYFYLRENSLPVEAASLKEMQWFYLADNQWFALSAREIVSDSTQRFMRSGIITLNIPADISQDNTVLPAGLSWLRVSSDHDLEKFCSLYSIHAQALRASRHLEQDTVPGNSIRLPAGAVSRARKSIPGVGAVKQIQPSFGGRLAEDRAHLRIRVSERLRHKKRALLPADYELLILEQFPQIYKVKCFPGMSPDFVIKQRFSPGHVLMVVVPYLAQNESVTQKPLLNGHLITEIQDFINQYVPPFVTAHILNPVYEVIQVRCTVKLKNPLLAGMYLERLNQAITDFLSPWNETVGYTRHFGWMVSKHDVESFIQSLDYVDRVTNLSILRIAPAGEDYFDLLDSADKPEDSEVKDIIPVYPWSIVAPIKQHFIEMDDRYDLIEPQITGIGELEIGSTFIISDEKWREKIEKH